ncbi:hypothetical protein DFP72DRAFT_1049170 [Ephemerocybe angulata]|uniref:Uncharacterized protein n=1 Tax=Ephemerocybe angulata TaxID=980116 RepID=A0A8H6M2C2_9AGAR|nr:hypothetical protein DFP72DRAFT_1049170 [Tulosesus angulatus]
MPTKGATDGVLESENHGTSEPRKYQTRTNELVYEPKPLCAGLGNDLWTIHPDEAAWTDVECSCKSRIAEAVRSHLHVRGRGCYEVFEIRELAGTGTRTSRYLALSEVQRREIQGDVRSLNSVFKCCLGERAEAIEHAGRCGEHWNAACHGHARGGLGGGGEAKWMECHVKGGSTDTRVEGEVELERTWERTKGSSVVYLSPDRPSKDGLLGGGIAGNEETSGVWPMRVLCAVAGSNSRASGEETKDGVETNDEESELRRFGTPTGAFRWAEWAWNGPNLGRTQVVFDIAGQGRRESRIVGERWVAGTGGTAGLGTMAGSLQTLKFDVRDPFPGRGMRSDPGANEKMTNIWGVPILFTSNLGGARLGPGLEISMDRPLTPQLGRSLAAEAPLLAWSAFLSSRTRMTLR